MSRENDLDVAEDEKEFLGFDDNDEDEFLGFDDNDEHMQEVQEAEESLFVQDEDSGDEQSANFDDDEELQDPAESSRGVKRQLSAIEEEVEELGNRRVSESQAALRRQAGDHTYWLPGAAEPRHISDVLGDHHVHDITQFHAQQPMKEPPGLTLVPYNYQLKDAGMMLHSLRSRFRGVINGNPMGLGKTLEMIMVLSEVKKSHGIIIIACPASVIPEWERQIQDAFDAVCTNQSNREPQFSANTTLKIGTCVARSSL